MQRFTGATDHSLFPVCLKRAHHTIIEPSLSLTVTVEIKVRVANGFGAGWDVGVNVAQESNEKNIEK